MRCFHVRNVVQGESDGMVEYVRLDELPVFHPFQREHITPGSVHKQEFHVRFGVQPAITLHECVVGGIQCCTFRLVLLVHLRLVSIKPLVAVAHGNVKLRLVLLCLVQLQRVKRSPVAGNTFQIAHLIAVRHQHSFFVVRFQFRHQRTGLH